MEEISGLSENQKSLLFEGKNNLTCENLFSEEGNCKLCSLTNTIFSSISDRNEHLVAHRKSTHVTQTREILGCRLSTVDCRNDKTKPSRFHHHCPLCFKSFFDKSRFSKHILSCSTKIPKTDKIQHAEVPKINSSKKIEREPRERSLTQPCPNCNKLIANSNFARHVKSHDDPIRTAMLVDHKNSIFMVRNAKSGSGHPIHVAMSTIPGHIKADCVSQDCKDAFTVAHNSNMIAFMCIHMASCKYAFLSELPAFDLKLAVKSMRYSPERIRAIIGYNESAQSNSSPLVAAFARNFSDCPSFLYFSVYEEIESYYSRLGRVIVTLNTKRQVLSCDCRKNTCIHQLIVRSYVSQVKPELLLDPGVKITDNTRLNVYDDDLNLDQHDGVNLGFDTVSIMVEYMLTEKRIPLKLDINYLTEDIPEKLTPVEVECHSCKGELVERKLAKQCKLISTTSIGQYVPIYEKQCSKCENVYRYQEYIFGWFNYNNFLVVSQKLLEEVLSMRVLQHSTLTEILDHFSRTRKIEYIYNNISNVLSCYLSFKMLEFDMVCGICSNKPNVIVFDTTRKVCFDIELEDRNLMEPPSKLPKYENYKEFYRDICKEDIARSLTNDFSIFSQFRVKLSRDWLPFMGTSVVVDSQPPSHRVQRPNPEEPNIFPILNDRIDVLQKKRYSNAQIRSMCQELGITCTKLGKKDMINAIAGSQVCYDEFTKQFFSLRGKSGGILRGMCEHGTCYTYTVLIEPEGVTDYAQTLLSFKDPPPVCCIDFAPQVAIHMNKIDPQFFAPYGGKIAPNTEENITKIKNKELLEFEGLLRTPHNDTPSGRVAVIDIFHENNHKRDVDLLHRIRSSRPVMNCRFNSGIVEQMNKQVLKHGDSLNKMKPDRFVKMFSYITEIENQIVNDKNLNKLKRKLPIDKNSLNKSTGKFGIAGHSEKYQKIGKRPQHQSATKRDRDGKSHDECNLSKHPRVELGKKKLCKSVSMPIGDKKHILLKNIPKHNLCWLNSIVHTIFGVQDIEFNVQKSRAEVLKFFDMMSGAYDFDVHVSFASYILELMRNEKITLNNKKKCILGEPQDIIEALEYGFYPLMNESAVSYKHTLVNLNEQSNCIQIALQNLVDEDLVVPNFIFLEPIRTIQEASSKKDPVYMDKNSFQIENLCKVVDLKGNIVAYVLQGFIAFTGPIVNGHYIAYVRSDVENEFYMIDGILIKKVNGHEYLDFARQTGQLFVYKRSLNYKNLVIKDPAPPHHEAAGASDPLSQSNNESIKTKTISSPESSTHDVSVDEDLSIKRKSQENKCTAGIRRVLKFETQQDQIHAKDSQSDDSIEKSIISSPELSTHNFSVDEDLPTKRKSEESGCTTGIKVLQFETQQNQIHVEDSQSDDSIEPPWVKSGIKSGRLEMYLLEKTRLLDCHLQLNDLVVDSFSAMLVNKYSETHFAGCISTQPIGVGSLKPSKGHFFQIVLVGHKHKGHWILLSNIGVHKHLTVVNVYDSSARKRYLPERETEIKKLILKIRPGAKIMNVVEVPQQNDGVNCGAFALYNAWCLLTKISPWSYDPDPVYIRKMLIKSFEKDSVQPLANRSNQHPSKVCLDVNIISSVKL